MTNPFNWLRGSATLTLVAACALGATSSSCYHHGRIHQPRTIDYGRPLPEGAKALIPLRRHERAPNLESTWYERDEILPALERSLQWTRSEVAKQYFPVEGISHLRALRSLEVFKDLLTTSQSPRQFQREFNRRFQVYRSAGYDGRGGGVLFTGYCTPLLSGSPQRTSRFRHPLHSLPPDLVKDEAGRTLGQETPNGLIPYPTRAEILASPEYQPLEIVWLEDPIDAYIAHVNGSAFVELPTGEIARFGYAGKNGRPYTSLGKELITAGEVPADEMSLAAIRRWAETNPIRVDDFLRRNESYIFFTEINGLPRGSLNIPVTARRTIATDKRLFPRGALTFIDTELPTPAGAPRPFRQLMFDQDTGGAIRTAGRADIYLGVGHEAERLSGATRASGQLYYFFLRG